MRKPWLFGVVCLLVVGSVSGGCSDTEQSDDQPGDAGSGGSSVSDGGEPTSGGGGATPGVAGSRASGGAGGDDSPGAGGEAAGAGGGTVSGGAAGATLGGAAGSAGAGGAEPTPIGTWAGTVTQEGETYQACLIITNVTEEDVPSGTVDYPDLACSGTVTYLGQSDAAYTFDEKITEGVANCVDGYVEATLLPSGDLQWAWSVTAGTAPLATAVLESVESCPEAP